MILKKDFYDNKRMLADLFNQDYNGKEEIKKEIRFKNNKIES